MIIRNKANAYGKVREAVPLGLLRGDVRDFGAVSMSDVDATMQRLVYDIRIAIEQIRIRSFDDREFIYTYARRRAQEQLGGISDLTNQLDIYRASVISGQYTLVEFMSWASEIQSRLQTIAETMTDANFWNVARAAIDDDMSTLERFARDLGEKIETAAKWILPITGILVATYVVSTFSIFFRR